jgi:hypothetical protein
LRAVPPALDLPGTDGTQQDQRQRDGHLPHRRAHGTSLKNMCPPNFSVCFAFVAQAGGVYMVIA